MDSILTLKSMTILLGQKQNDLVFKIHFWVTSIKREFLRIYVPTFCIMFYARSEFGKIPKQYLL